MQPTRHRWPLLLGSVLLAGYFLALNLANLRFGRADNGDFTRLAAHWVTKPQGFSVNWPAADDPEWQRRFFNCWLRYWERQPSPAAAPPLAPDTGTTWFFWQLASWLGRILSPGEVFDLLYVGGLVRAACLALLLAFYGLAAVQLGLRSWVLPVLIAMPLAASLADPRNTTFFNSFYREAGTLTFALLTVCGLLALPGRRFWAAALVATAGAMLLAGSAPAHFFTALLAAAALAAAFLRRWQGAGRGRRGAGAAGWLAIALAVAALLAAGRFSERRTDRTARKNNAYHTLFVGALEVSDAPEAHLAFLGLPRQARELIGTHAFGPASQRFIQEHWNRLGHRATARVLLREPVLVPRMLRRAALSVNDPASVLGAVSHEACDGRPLRLAWWTAVKVRLGPAGDPLLALLAAAALLGLGSLFAADPRVFGVGLALAFSSLGALGELAVAVLGDGFFELSRHLLTAVFFTDVVLALLIWRLVLAWVRRRETVQAAEHIPHL
jgi:hypothetical protein